MHFYSDITQIHLGVIYDSNVDIYSSIFTSSLGIRQGMCMYFRANDIIYNTSVIVVQK